MFPFPVQLPVYIDVGDALSEDGGEGEDEVDPEHENVAEFGDSG